MNSVVDAAYQFFVEGLPYITIAVFLLGIALNVRRWYGAPKESGRGIDGNVPAFHFFTKGFISYNYAGERNLRLVEGYED